MASTLNPDADPSVVARVLAADPEAVHIPAGTDVFDALGITPSEETTAKRVRRRLIVLLGDHIRAEGWTQAHAAEVLDLDQPRVSDVLRGRIERFSIDKLVTLLAKVDVRVDQVLDRGLMATAE